MLPGMWVDVADLRDFYASGLGQSAGRIVSSRVRELWPSVQGESVLGLGYAPPYLEPFRDEASHLIAAMPAGQGVLPWTGKRGGQTALVNEFILPLPDSSMNRILLVHALECADHVQIMLREIWRVVAEGGRLIVIVPNRTGLWSRLERTPFGHGKPYSPSQLFRLLRDNLFTPLNTRHALFMPPFRARFMLGSASAWERAGGWMMDSFAGVVVIEAVKQIYAVPPAAEPHRLAGYLPIPKPSYQGRR